MPLIKQDNDGIYLCGYRDRKATKDEILIEQTRLMKAYPRQNDPNFYEELKLAIAETGMTKQQLHDAVIHVIRTEEWLSICKVVQHQKKIRLYTPEQFEWMRANRSAQYGDYTIVHINSTAYRVRKTDLQENSIDLDKLNEYIEKHGTARR